MSTKAALHPATETDELYATALAGYLKLGGEDCLHRGYELGRRAIREGRSILQMIELHQRVVAQILSTMTAGIEAASVVEASSGFFGEVMSSFEMTNRAFGEAKAALEHVNELLESEVKGIADRLHDGTGQLLAAVHMRLEDVSHDVPVHVRECLQEVRGILDQVETELRGLSHELRPPTLDVQGLFPALQNLAAAVSRRAGLRVIVESTGPLLLSSKSQVVVYRVIQEALKNAAKHARAQCVGVSLSIEGGFLSCSVEDDGIGFDKDALLGGQGLGLLCIRERLQALHGSFEIQSAPGSGTRLNIRVPCETEHVDTRIAC